MDGEAGSRIDRMLARGLRLGTVGCFIGLIFFVAAGVLVRFFPFSSMGWADEIVEFGFAWMVFLGAAALGRDRSHFRVDFLPKHLAGRRSGRILESLLSLLALIFFLVFTYQGIILSERATDRSPILELPRYLWYVVMPICGSILIGYTLRDLGRFFRRSP